MLTFTLSGQHNLNQKLCCGDEGTKTLLIFMKELCKNMGGKLGTVQFERKYEYQISVRLPSIEDAETFIKTIQTKLTPQMTLVSETVPPGLATILPFTDSIAPYYSGDGINHCASVYALVQDDKFYVDSSGILRHVNESK